MHLFKLIFEPIFLSTRLVQRHFFLLVYWLRRLTTEPTDMGLIVSLVSTSQSIWSLQQYSMRELVWFMSEFLCGGVRLTVAADKVSEVNGYRATTCRRCTGEEKIKFE